LRETHGSPWLCPDRLRNRSSRSRSKGREKREKDESRKGREKPEAVEGKTTGVGNAVSTQTGKRGREGPLGQCGRTGGRRSETMNEKKNGGKKKSKKAGGKKNYLGGDWGV